MHAIKMAVADDKNDIFRPVGVICGKFISRYKPERRLSILTFDECGQGKNSRHAPQIVPVSQAFPRGTNHNRFSARCSGSREDSIGIGAIQDLEDKSNRVHTS